MQIFLLIFSARGVNEFFKGDVRFLSLSKWSRERHLYATLLSIRFFRQFRLTKTFGTWKNVVRRQKFSKAAKSLQESSCLYGNRHMRACFARLQGHLSKLEDMGVTDVQVASIKH